MPGPATFELAAHAQRTFIVSVDQPPPGQSELVAAFYAADRTINGVATNAGVGTALRFSEPGTTVQPPCPKPKPAKNPNVHTVYLGASNIKPPSTGISPMLFGGTIGGLFLILALVLALRRYRPRMFKRGVHHS